MNNDDFIKIVNDVKSMEYIDGSFYRNGWNDACDMILNSVKILDESTIDISELKDRYYGI